MSVDHYLSCINRETREIETHRRYITSFQEDIKRLRVDIKKEREKATRLLKYEKDRDGKSRIRDQRDRAINNSKAKADRKKEDIAQRRERIAKCREDIKRYREKIRDIKKRR